MRVTIRPSRMNLFASWTFVVHGPGPVPTCRLEPLARLINWRRPGEFLVTIAGHTLLTDVLPLPVDPMTL